MTDFDSTARILNPATQIAALEHEIATRPLTARQAFAEILAARSTFETLLLRLGQDERFLRSLPQECADDWCKLLDLDTAVDDRITVALAATLRRERELFYKGIAIGLRKADRLDLVETDPAVENAWLLIQAERLLQEGSPPPIT